VNDRYAYRILDIGDISQHKDIGVSVAWLHRSDPVIQILHCHYLIIDYCLHGQLPSTNIPPACPLPAEG